MQYLTVCVSLSKEDIGMLSILQITTLSLCFHSKDTKAITSNHGYRCTSSQRYNAFADMALYQTFMT